MKIIIRNCEKIFRKMTLGNINFCKLRNIASWTSQSLRFLSKISGCASYHPLLTFQKGRPKLLAIGRKIQSIIFYCRNTFFTYWFWNISSIERVERLKFWTLWFRKFSSHLFLWHSSLIIYWGSPCGLWIFYFLYISTIDIFSCPLNDHFPFKRAK